MKNTEVLHYLVRQLQNVALITNDKDFLTYIGIDIDPAHIKRLSGHLNRRGAIRDKSFLKAIEKKFEFNESIWNRNDSKQKSIIQDAIKKKLSLKLLPNEEALDISNILQTRQVITEEQLKLLDNFSKLNTKVEAETMINDFLSSGLLNKQIENQEFLVNLLTETYKKGLYLIIVEFILPNLYRHYLLLPNVQKIEAHTLGSLGSYDEAKHILDILIHHNTIENINLRTSALSNHKRELFQTKEEIDANKLYTLVKGYQELHAINGIYSYYTGINLLYMVVLGQTLFMDDERFLTIDTQAIYSLSRPSLGNDKTHDTYYVSMSGFEFKLLLGERSILKSIESFLAIYEPHISLVERTSRQMNIFIHTIEKSDSSLLKLFQEAEDILNGYISSQV